MLSVDEEGMRESSEQTQHIEQADEDDAHLNDVEEGLRDGEHSQEPEDDSDHQTDEDDGYE